MPDGAVIVGVVGVLTSGVIGPTVLNRIQTNRDSRTDLRTALDSATEPLVSAAVAWVRAHAFDTARPADFDQRLGDLMPLVYLVESHALRLEMRFDGDLPRAYGATGGAVSEQARVLWDHSRGRYPSRSQVEAALAEADVVYADAYRRFVADAQHWDRGAERGFWRWASPVRR
jgi:hypothetical protein